jgi:hypothetical protein
LGQRETSGIREPAINESEGVAILSVKALAIPLRGNPGASNQIIVVGQYRTRALGDGTVGFVAKSAQDPGKALDTAVLAGDRILTWNSVNKVFDDASAHRVEIATVKGVDDLKVDQDIAMHLNHVQTFSLVSTPWAAKSPGDNP